MENVVSLLHNIVARLDRLERHRSASHSNMDMNKVDLFKLATFMRRMRDEQFPRDYFADAAWELLLDIYTAETERRKTSMSDLGLGAAIPLTTTLRYIDKLESDGFVMRTPDPQDKRRIFVTLSDTGRMAMANIAQRAEQWIAAQPRHPVTTSKAVNMNSASNEDYSLGAEIKGNSVFL
jgi:DNA-binding MarR family transcriptional regulator